MQAEADGKRLYCVKVEFEYFALAASEADAEEMWQDAKRDLWEPDYVMVSPLRRAQDIPKEWCDSIPYGEEDDRTCAQILGTTWAEIVEANRAEFGAARPISGDGAGRAAEDTKGADE